MSFPLLISICLAVQNGVQVLAPDALFTTAVVGLANTDATADLFNVQGQAFDRGLRVTIHKASAETNATQLTLPTASAVEAGDTMLASFWVRGEGSGGGKGRMLFLFEKTTDPWTKSITQGVSASDTWHRIRVPFAAAQSYAAGTAMASFRFAFGPQTIELGGIELTDLGKNRSLESVVDLVLADSPIGTVSVALDVKHPRQTMMGFGGDFCQARYGSTETMDPVGAYVLENLNVVHARVGLPLNYWNPTPGEYRDDAQAAASLRTLAEMTKRHIPTALSIWEAAGWLLGGNPEQSGRVLPKEKYSACIEAIAKYLVLARDKYGAKVDYLSFNEPDYGVNFTFTPDTMRDFIRQAGPRFIELGLKTKFLVGDTSGGASYTPFALPILQDASISSYLGPLSFHCWDVLSSTDEEYQSIAALGERFHKPVWCLEAGHDSALWQASNPWATWDNALRTAMAYEKTLRLSEASLMDYWTYEDNYPIVDKAGPTPYPVFYAIRDMESVFGPGTRVVRASVGNPDLQALGTVDGRGNVDVLLVNSGGPGKAVLTGLKPNELVRMLTRDKSGPQPVLGKADSSGGLTVAVPLRSMVTILDR